MTHTIPSTGRILSRLIIGPRCMPATEAQIVANQPEVATSEIGFTVMETEINVGLIKRKIYCCWSGGKMDPKTKQPMFTMVGLGAMEALCSLPGPKEILIFAELRNGPTPLQTKIIERIMQAPEGARICFVGDLAKELDGQMALAFNLTGKPIMLEELEK